MGYTLSNGIFCAHKAETGYMHIQLPQNVMESKQVHVVIPHTHLTPPYCCIHAWSVLVQTMACRLFGARPLPEPMLAYCQ